MNIKESLQNAATLSQATTALQHAGFTVNFEAGEECITALNSKNEYKPEDLKILASLRFEGQSNPADSTQLMALEANDGVKGTIILSHSATHSHNEEMIKRIPFAEEVIRG